MNKERNLYMDIVKGIGILLVVIGHCETPIGRYIYLFHMPLFFFISGYFYKDKYSNNPVEFIVKKIKTLYRPYIFFAILLIIMHNVFLKVGFYSSTFSDLSIEYSNMCKYFKLSDIIKYTMKVLLLGQVDRIFGGALWFFISLIMASITFNIISYIKIKTNKKEIFRAITIGILFNIAYLSTKFNINFHGINTAMIATGLFYCGYLYSQYDNKVKLNLEVAIICFFILIISGFYGSINMAGNEYTNIAFFIINSLAGIYIVLFIATLVKKINLLSGILSYMGRNTIPVIGLHFISFKIVDIVRIVLFSMPYYTIGKFPVIDVYGMWWVVYALVGVTIPLIINIYYKKSIKIFTSLIINSKSSN